MAAPAAPASHPRGLFATPYLVDLLKECFLHVSPPKLFPLRIHVTAGVRTLGAVCFQHCLATAGLKASSQMCR